jgi:transcriptional regulator with XRE-family HTH domain
MSERDEHEVIGGRLREAREFVGLLQDEAASALGIPRTSLSALEAGKRKVSGVELRRLARLYRRPVDWLLGEDHTSVAETDPLFRATARLSDEDKEQVLRFAEFLAAAGRPGTDIRAAAGKSTPRKRVPKT